MTSTPVVSYVAGGPTFNYPAAGDPVPPGGAKVLLLTIGGICIVGQWNTSHGAIGWAPLPKRDKAKEASISKSPT